MLVAGNTGGATNQQGVRKVAGLKPTVLLTRPHAQSQEIRAALSADVNVQISPVLEIVPLKIQINADDYALFIFASRNAVLAAAKSMDLSGRRAITVGDRTAKAATQLGMTAISAKGTAAQLIQTVQNHRPAGKAIFLRGEHSQGNIAETLKMRGIDTDSTVIYRQLPLSLNEAAREILCGDNPVVLPLFSARSAAILSGEALNCRATAPLVLVAISPDVLAVWNGPIAAQSVVARKPTAAAMLKEISGQIDRHS